MISANKRRRHGLNLGAFIFAAVLMLAAGCDRSESGALSVIEEGGKATGIQIPTSLLEVHDTTGLRVSMEGNKTPMLGKFKPSAEGLTFVPVVPLTRGKTYVVSSRAGALATITVAKVDAPAPELLAVYPTADTVPENLLKVYLRFSTPMMEGRSASFVHLLKDGRDTMSGTFLDLQPELWNQEGTVLTLWLDPGRIKLDLIPNKEMGNPLTKGMHYELVVGSGWRSKEGAAMRDVVRKRFFVGERDDKSPEINTWKMELPAAGSQQPFRLQFNESLDRMLIESGILVLDEERKPVAGKFGVGSEDSTLEFIPDNLWSKGSYFISVEPRLEDLAGNNLNRLFETDLSKPGARKQEKSIYERGFSIQ